MKSDLRIRNLAPLQWSFAAALCCALLFAPCASQSASFRACPAGRPCPSLESCPR
ncbi:hypothetical protein [Desulfovibrio sp. QI0442]